MRRSGDDFSKKSDAKSSHREPPAAQGAKSPGEADDQASLARVDCCGFVRWRQAGRRSKWAGEGLAGLAGPAIDRRATQCVSESNVVVDPRRFARPIPELPAVHASASHSTRNQLAMGWAALSPAVSLSGR